MSWCEAQFGNFDEKLRLDKGRRERIESALGAFKNFCQRDEQLRVALAEEPFLQGSVPNHTAIRPIGIDEYDVDVVYPFRLSAFQGTPPGPKALFDWFISRLKLDEKYRGAMQVKNRCVRVHYAGDFHVDLIPSTKDVSGHQPYAVPARDLSAWITNDPRGFVAWAAKKDSASGMPDGEGHGVFVRSVRIMKRWRDQFFGSNPRLTSILLTTILGKHEASAKSYQPPLQDSLYPRYNATAAYLFDMLRLTQSCIQLSERASFTHPTIPDEDLRRDWDPPFTKLFLERLNATIGSLKLAIYVDNEAQATEHYRAAFGETFPRG